MLEIPFFSNMWCVIRRQGDSIFWWDDIQQKGKVQNFLAYKETLKFPPLVGHSSWDFPYKENLEEGA